MYWSQKSFNITDALIDGLSKPGEIVFDPFMGSGVTIIESVIDKYSRNAIGVDINDVPIFIVDTLLSKNIPFATFKKKIKSFQEKAHKLCDTEYITNFGGKEVMVTTTTFDIVNNFKKLTECKGVTVQGRKKITFLPRKSELLQLDKERKIKNIPSYIFLENSKIAAGKEQDISTIFTPRNFYVLDCLIGLMNEKEFKEIKEAVKYILLSMIHLCKITDTHSNSQWPIWIPSKNCVEKNVLLILDRRIELTCEALRYSNTYFKKTTRIDSFKKIKGSSNYFLLKKGIQDITKTDIPDESVDLIITDPPYLGQVEYSEYMQIYEPFLGTKINFEDEIVVSTSPKREKSLKQYFDLLDKAFEICSAKLKQGKYFCMYFHDCNLSVWDKLIGSLSRHGLRFLTMTHIDKSTTLKNIISPKKSLNGDALLFFAKESVVDKENSSESIHDIELNIIKEAKHMLSTADNKMTTPQFYDNGLMEIIIHNGWLKKISKKYKTLVELFEKHFVWIGDGGYWTIPDE